MLDYLALKRDLKELVDGTPVGLPFRELHDLLSEKGYTDKEISYAVDMMYLRGELRCVTSPRFYRFSVVNAA